MAVSSPWPTLPDIRSIRPAKLILKSTAARLDLEQIATNFDALGGPEVSAIAKAFWSGGDESTLLDYATHCMPLYSPVPPDPQDLDRCVLNFELLKGFYGQMAMDLRSSLSKVTVPTLVIAGSKDPLTPPARAEEIVAALGSKEALLEVFEQSGHYVHLTEPDRFFALIESFVEDSSSTVNAASH